MATANIVVQSTLANVTVDSSNSNVNVTNTQTNVQVSASAIISNASIRAAIGNVDPVLFDTTTGVISLNNTTLLSGQTTANLTETAAIKFFKTSANNQTTATLIGSVIQADHVGGSPFTGELRGSNIALQTTDSTGSNSNGAFTVGQVNDFSRVGVDSGPVVVGQLFNNQPVTGIQRFQNAVLTVGPNPINVSPGFIQQGGGLIGPNAFDNGLPRVGNDNTNSDDTRKQMSRGSKLLAGGATLYRTQSSSNPQLPANGNVSAQDGTLTASTVYLRDSANTYHEAGNVRLQLSSGKFDSSDPANGGGMGALKIYGDPFTGTGFGQMFSGVGGKGTSVDRTNEFKSGHMYIGDSYNSSRGNIFATVSGSIASLLGDVIPSAAINDRYGTLRTSIVYNDTTESTAANVSNQNGLLLAHQPTSTGGSIITTGANLHLYNGNVYVNRKYALPIADGTAGQSVITDGNGALSFTSIGSFGGLLLDSNPGLELSGSVSAGYVLGSRFLSLDTSTTASDAYYYIVTNGSGVDKKIRPQYINVSGLNNDANYTSNASAVTHIATAPLTVGGNLTVNGNINATGNINYQNVTDLYVTDQKITLNANATADATVEIISNRPQSTHNAIISWNEGAEKWTFMNGDNVYQDILTTTQVVSEARGAVSVTDAGGLGSAAYNSGTGVITYTGPADSDVRGLVSVTDAGGLGSAAYNSSTGVITYTGPSDADVRGLVSVTQASASGTGALAYNNSSGVLTYTPPVLPTGDIEGVTAGVGLSGGGTTGTVTVNLDPTITTASASAGGSLAYDNSSGVFTFAPAITDNLSNALTDVNSITSEQPSVITAGSFATGYRYKIRTVGNTNFTLIGAGTSTTAGAFVTGTEYTIITTGSTDFTAIGAADSNPGTTFTATGAGTGTGTAGDFARHTIFTATGAGTGTGTAIEEIDLVLKSYDNTKINTFIDDNATEGMTIVPSGRAIKSTASYRGPNAAKTRTGTDSYHGVTIAGSALSGAFGRQAKIVFTAGSNVVQIYGGYNENWNGGDSVSIANTYQNGMVLMNTSEISDYQSYTYPLSSKAHTISLANSALSYAYNYGGASTFDAYDANVIMSEVSPVDFTWQSPSASDRGIGMWHTLANSDGDQVMFSTFLGGIYNGGTGGNIATYLPVDKNKFCVSDNGNIENYSSYTAGSLANVTTGLAPSDITVGTGFPSSSAFRSTKQTTITPTQGSAKFANIVLIGNNAQYDDTMAGHIYYPSFGINAVWDGVQDLEADTNPDFGNLGAPITTGMRFKQFTDRTAQDPTSSVTGELSTAGARMLLSSANSNVSTSEATHRPITNQGIGVYGFFGSSEQEVAPRTRSLLPAGMFAVASETWVANTGTDMYFVSTPQGKKGIDTDNNAAHGFLASQNGETSVFGTSKVSFFQSGNAYNSGNIVAGFNTLKSGTEWANISSTGVTTTGTVKSKSFTGTPIALGNQSGDVSSALNIANGDIYSLTATGGITINTIANAVAGSRFTVVVTQDGTGSHALTSSMKFKGGDKGLTSAGGSIDIIDIFYDGTTYFAELTKAYA